LETLKNNTEKHLKSFDVLGTDVTKRDEQIEALEKKLERERDARREERFVFIVLVLLLLDVVFFSIMDTFGGPVSLVVLELLILIPLARRMGMQEIAGIINRVIDNVANGASKKINFKQRSCVITRWIDENAYSP